MIKFITLFVLSLMVASNPASAFILIRAGAFQKGERPVSEGLIWSGRTVSFHINTNQSIHGGSIAPELTSAEFQSAINTAVAQWNNVCGSDITVRIAGTTTNTVNSGDSTNTIVWDNRTTAEGNGIASTGTLAVAYSSVDNTSDTTVSCDISVNGEATGNFAIDGNAAGYDLVGILVHEIGHCLGLDHSVEPPTFTSANSILLSASMKSTVAAGDLSARTISQDEIDGMECINPSGKTVRTGTFCTSYHGTSGNGALSGTVSGGPTSERVCGTGTSAAITSSASTGGGCVSKAIASDGKSNPDNSLKLGWIFIVLVSAVLLKLFRWIRVLLPLLLFVWSQPSFAGIEVVYQRTMAKPALVNNATAFTTSEGTFTTQKGDPSSFKTFSDFQVALNFESTPDWSWGVFYQSGLENKVELKGYNSSDTLLMTKETELSGWVGGLTGRYYFFPQSLVGNNYFFEGQLGWGKSFFKQKILENTGLLHLANASATAVQVNAFLGTIFQVIGRLDLIAKVGYSRLQTNYYVVDSASGSRFSSLTAGNRVALRTGEELRLVRNGFSAHAGIHFRF